MTEKAIIIQKIMIALVIRCIYMYNKTARMRQFFFSCDERNEFMVFTTLESKTIVLSCKTVERLFCRTSLCNDACVRSIGSSLHFMRLKEEKKKKKRKEKKTFLRDSTRVYLKAETYLSSRRSLRCEKNIHLLLQRLAPQ